MSTSNIRLIISGFELMLFGVIVAICNQSAFAYIPGGLGLLFVIIACAAKD